MPDKTKEFMKNAIMVMGLITMCASPIIAVTVATQAGKSANAKADKALDLAEQNARDFAFFKGEVNAKLENLNKGQDRIYDIVKEWERE
jgi:hypothetical protein